MRGREVAERGLVVPPQGVVCLESIDIGIFSNLYATRAHRFIRDYMAEASSGPRNSPGTSWASRVDG